MRVAHHPMLTIAAALLAVVLASCAQAPPASEPDALAEFKATNDPLEPTNRVFYAINDGLDTVVLRPIALGYRYVVPPQVRDGIHNVLSNISSPVLLANDMLQTSPRRAGDTLMRLLINTTVGVVGIFDVATGWGYPAHPADFGMTLALWGVPDGPFLFLPILGPSDPRDATGFGVDVAIDPLTWVGQGYIVTDLKLGRAGLEAVDAREQALDPVDQIKRTALDPYATFRSLYRQHRASEIDAARTGTLATKPGWFPQQ